MTKSEGHGDRVPPYTICGKSLTEELVLPIGQLRRMTAIGRPEKASNRITAFTLDRAADAREGGIDLTVDPPPIWASKSTDYRFSPSIGHLRGHPRDEIWRYERSQADRPILCLAGGWPDASVEAAEFSRRQRGRFDAVCTKATDGSRHALVRLREWISRRT